jgi:hypothetical protein
MRDSRFSLQFGRQWSRTADHLGTPAPGTKVFVSVHQMVDGYTDVLRRFSAIVPSAATISWIPESALEKAFTSGLSSGAGVVV